LPDQRVDFLITGLELGGAESQLIRLVARLQSRGLPVRVISMLTPGPLGPAMRQTGVPVLDLGMARGTADLRGFVRLVHLWRRQPPSAVVSFLYHANLLARLAGRAAGVRLIVSSIRNERFGSRFREALFRMTDGFGHLNVVNSSLAATTLRERGLVPRRGIEVIPNGIRAADFQPVGDARERTRMELGLPRHEFAWFCIGRMVPQKDHHTLLLAFDRLRSTPVRLVLVGDGPLRAALEQVATGAGLSDRVLFLGERDDVVDLLSAADALVLSSAWEGMPNVVMEALAAGVPVVATAVGGLPELVASGESGWLVPPGDVGALAAAMSGLQSLPPGERRRMGRRGQEHITALFDLERVVDQWEALLTSVQYGCAEVGT
jgi:glycosyltransferase involved in cell wall biosynthesis